MLLVLCSLLGMTPGFGQDVVLKKLYDGIEDMRLEVKSRAAEMISRALNQNPMLENFGCYNRHGSGNIDRNGYRLAFNSRIGGVILEDPGFNCQHPVRGFGHSYVFCGSFIDRNRTFSKDFCAIQKPNTELIRRS
jgi:hypothetical protein